MRRMLAVERTFFSDYNEEALQARSARKPGGEQALNTWQQTDFVHVRKIRVAEMNESSYCYHLW